MKNRDGILKAAVLVAAGLMTAGSVYADAGGGGMDTGGGDLAQIRETRLRALVGSLREDLLDYLGSANQVIDPNAEVAQIIKETLDRGLIEDVRTSTYRLATDCRDSAGTTRAGSARIGGRGGEICLNLPLLVASNAVEQDLFSLVIHEHAHQLGVSTEVEAIRIGEAFAPRIAAHRFYFPREGQARILVPVNPERKECLSFRTLLERPKNAPVGTNTWKGAVDLEFTGSEPISSWFKMFAVQLFARPPKLDHPSRESDDYEVYQDGCRAVFMPMEPGKFVELPIVSYSRTHIEILNSIWTQPALIKFTMPEGSQGNRMYMESRFSVTAALECEQPENSRPPETHSVTGVMGYHIGPGLPEAVSVRPRLLTEMHDALYTALFLPKGCIVVMKLDGAKK